MKRRPTREIQIGNITIGGDNPIVVQTMTNTPTSDVAATADQVVRLAHAGAEMVRITVQTPQHAKALTEIRKRAHAAGVDVPLIADIHFVPQAGLEALKTADKVRLNPGNFLDRKTSMKQTYTDEEYAAELSELDTKLVPFITEVKKHRTPLRIGANHGSLSDRILNRYGDTAEGMVESALEYLRIFRKHGVKDIVVAMKASDALVMLDANRLLVTKLTTEGSDNPIHLGVTEAGNADDGRVKSTVGMAPLLMEGIGDTIRVSLTEDPVKELSVAYAILQATHRRITKTEFISCPSCGRTLFDLEETANRIKEKTGHLKGIRIAIMGCIVNGLGEMADADFGYVGGAPGKINLFVRKQRVKTDVPQEHAVDELIALIKREGKWQEPPKGMT